MDEFEVHEAMGAALIAMGKATPEDVAADRAALEARLNGQELPADRAPATAPPAQAAPTLTSAALMGVSPESAPLEPPDELTVAAFQGPSSPAAYQFDTPPLAPGTAPDPQAMAMEQSFRELFHAEGMPVPIAKEISRLAGLGAANPPSNAQIDFGRQTAQIQLERMWGPDYQTNLNIANAELARMTKARPEIPQILQVTGLGNSVYFAATLVNLARAKGRVR